LGDQIAFAELYRLTSGKLYAIASRMLRRADTASEALQEAHLHIWTLSDRYDPAKRQPIYWMAGIIRHFCIEMLRSSKSRHSLGPDIDEVERVIPPHDIGSVDIERSLRHLDVISPRRF
jgi:RNA polymerase sigma-70 factor (ECF subfamily)